jgi:hypothetical protein
MLRLIREDFGFLKKIAQRGEFSKFNIIAEMSCSEIVALNKSQVICDANDQANATFLKVR